MRVIGMEISELGFKAVEIKLKGRYPKVLGFCLGEFAKDRPKGELIREALREKGFGSGAVNLAFPEKPFIHRLIELPPLTRRELSIALPREVDYEMSNLIEGDFDYAYQLVEGGAMVAAASRKVIRGCLEVAEEAGLRCSVLTTVPSALLNLLKLKGRYLVGPTLFVHVGGRTCHLSIGEGERLMFATSMPAQGEEGELDKLVSRAARAAFLFRERYGRKVSYVMVSGEPERLTRLAGGLRDGLGIAVEIFDHKGALDTSPLGEEMGLFQSLVPSFAVPIGLALKRPKDFQLNLLSGGVGRPLFGMGRAKEVIALALSGLILIGLISYSSIELGEVERRYEASLAELKSSLERLRSMREESEGIKREREVYASRLKLLRRLGVRGELWARALEALRGAVPEGIVLRSVTIKREGAAWRMSLRGEVEAEELLESVTLYNRFLSNLRRCPFFKNPQAGPLQPSAEGRRFEVSCELGWRPLVISPGEGRGSPPSSESSGG